METIRVAMDMTVLAASGAMALYCAQLSRRLAGLRTGRDETAASIKRLTQAIEQSQRSAAQIALAADEAGARMREASAALAHQCQTAEDLSGMLDGQSGQAARRLAAAQATAETALTRATERASIELEALTRAVELTADAEHGIASRSVTSVRAAGPVRQRAAAEQNPFLRAVG